VKKKKSEASDGDAKTRRKERKVKSTTKACEPSISEESSEEEEYIKSRRTSHRKKSSGKSAMKKEKSDTDEDDKKKDRTKKTKKYKAETGSESTSSARSNESGVTNDSMKKSTEKEKHRRGRHVKKWLVLEKFDGTTPLSIFLNQLDTSAKYNGWNLADKAAHLRVSLKGNAAYIINDENLEGASYQRLIKQLKSRFGTKGQSSLYHSHLRTRRRGKNETLVTLYHDINRIAGLAYPGKNSMHRELAAIEASIDALNDRHLRMRVRDREPKNLEHALHIALLADGI